MKCINAEDQLPEEIDEQPAIQFDYIDVDCDKFDSRPCGCYIDGEYLNIVTQRNTLDAKTTK